MSDVFDESSKLELLVLSKLGEVESLKNFKGIEPIGKPELIIYEHGDQIRVDALGSQIEAKYFRSPVGYTSSEPIELKDGFAGVVVQFYAEKNKPIDENPSPVDTEDYENRSLWEQ